MADIFISYASEDRNKAEELAEALSTHAWSVWWDRKIPLGKSYDEVIEKALGESKCVIVLWSAVSVVSEWVRNEASEAKRRGILVPVVIERVDAPLAFKLLNSAERRVVDVVACWHAAQGIRPAGGEGNGIVRKAAILWVNCANKKSPLPNP